MTSKHTVKTLNQMTIRVIVLSILILCALSGCQSEDGFSANGDSAQTGSTASTASGIQLGANINGLFQAGKLAIAVNPLSAGGTTSVTANLISADGTVHTTVETIQFSSVCSGQGLATLDTDLSTVNGSVTSTYIAKGCSGSDTITAIATVDGTVLTASGSVSITSSVLGSIQFTSATPQTIALKGTGGAGLSENSTVVFTLVDQAGGPVINQAVNFSLSTTVGGITLSASSGNTNALGQVQTIVNSGSVATSVRVNASSTIPNTSVTISTQSVALAISTGIPDQNSFSISIETLNPEVWELNGVIVPVTIFAADHFNNPAPDGTAIAFQTEGGIIDGSCTTLNGQCTVNWTSNDPRPADGRSTIIATAIGEEGFADLNGNGVFDDGDTFTDLDEAFRDDNENSTREPAEEFLDFDNSKGFSLKDTFYNGTLCAHSTVCDPAGKLVHVRSSNVMVMASRFQSLVFKDSGGTVITPPVVLPDSGASVSLNVEVQDVRGQVPPVGTKITGSVDGAGAGKLLGAIEGVVPNTNAVGPVVLGLTLAAKTADVSDDSGLLTVTLELPGSAVKTSASVAMIVSDVTAPTIASTVPVPGATGVDGTQAIKAIFSEAMSSTSITSLTFTVFEDPLGANTQVNGGLINYDPATKTALFLPTTALTPGAFHSATITTGALDAAGNPVASNFSWSFKVQ